MLYNRIMVSKDGYPLRAGATVLAFLLILGTSLPAQDESEPAGQTAAGVEDRKPGSADSLTPGQAGRDFLGDASRIWSAPARVRGKHIVPLLAVAAATTFLIAADVPIREGIQSFSEEHVWVGHVGPMITPLGGLAGFTMAGAFFGAGLLFRDTGIRDTGYLAASAFLQSFILVNFLKGMTGRQRPSVADGTDHWAGPSGFFKRFEKGNADIYESFPSGHAAAAFSLATVFALRYAHHRWVPIVAYTLAAGVGLSRMTLDLHWASDVAVGALIGHLVARLVVRNYAQRRRIVPTITCSGHGFTLGVCFDLDPAHP
jgi:membrane-associated phospholipid phosphatase